MQHAMMRRGRLSHFGSRCKTSYCNHAAQGQDYANASQSIACRGTDNQAHAQRREASSAGLDPTLSHLSKPRALNVHRKKHNRLRVRAPRMDALPLLLLHSARLVRWWRPGRGGQVSPLRRICGTMMDPTIVLGATLCLLASTVPGQR